MKKKILFSVVAVCFAATSVYAQRGGAGAGGAAGAAGGGQQPTGREDSLDPTPVGASDPNVGMFVNDWRNSKPRAMYGKLAFHDILTGLEGPDPQHPTKKGAVLTAITAISYATLDPGGVATGREQAGQRQTFFATGNGAGQVTVNGKSFDVKDGVGFVLTPDFDFKMTSSGKEALAFYVRTEPIPAGTPAVTNFTVTNRFDNDRRIGAHWVHICNGGPNGMNLCTIAPHTMPQPHSHPGEECWIMVKGESILSLGKTVQKMTPGQAYKIPPTGLAAHSNLNMGEEPVEMIFMGPAGNGGGGRGRGGAPAAAASVAPEAAPITPPPAPAPQAGRGGAAPTDFARLDNAPIVLANQYDVDMFMNNWRDAYPKILHGNMYFRDMLTAAQGDSQHPTRKGAVLTNAEAVSYAMLEPGASAHPLAGELKDVQETFVVNSGTGTITSGGKTTDLAKDMAFILTPGLDFKLTATGDKYMTFYVVTEKVPQGVTPKAALTVVDNRNKPTSMNAWVDNERPLITKNDGLLQYNALMQVEQGTMTMSRPYSDGKDVEEIWIATEGDGDMLFGKELRKLPAGTAYRVPSTGITAHANINITGKTDRFLYMVK
jgi:mannose-6-phosphate isomerase-like protein (cupin superfamily)